MAIRLSPNDRKYMISIVEGTWHGRLTEKREDQLIEVGYLTYENGSLTNTPQGLAAIQSELGDRMQARLAAKAKQDAYEADKKAREDAVWTQLEKAGCKLLSWVRLIPVYNGDRSSQLVFDVGFASVINLRQDSNTGLFGIYTRMSEGKLSISDLIEEAQQAQIACDLLNAKLAEAKDAQS